MLSLGRGMFVNEIQSELMNGNINIAVHSAKDLTVEIPEDLIIGAYTERLDASGIPTPSKPNHYIIFKAKPKGRCSSLDQAFHGININDIQIHFS